MAALIQSAAGTPVLVGENMDQKKSSLGEPLFLVASSGFVSNINAPTTTAFNDSQPTVKLAHRAHKINDQLEDVFMEEAYSVFLSSNVQ